MIAVSHLTKTFGRLVAVQDVSFRVEKGEIFAFLGPNGAGKTTTVKMLTTLLKPTAGRVKIDGLDTIRDAKDVRRKFGMVFQDASLDGELTAHETLDFHGSLYRVPRNVRAGRIERLLNLFELWERRDHKAKQLSGGMQRRLEIARCLLHVPEIIFLDEPTLGLDPQTRHQLWAQVLKLNQEEGVTVFLTTHYLEEAERVADRIAVIDHGSIIAQGSPAEIKQQADSDTLEGAFLALTGSSIREEKATGLPRMRSMVKITGR
jgi:ABC-2 type transport system ATP-binding protein